MPRMRHPEEATLYPVETPPVELNAVTRTARRDRVTLLDLQRLGNVAFKSEPMRFQVTAVGTGGEQMHGAARCGRSRAGLANAASLAA